MKITEVTIDKVKPYGGNPRKMSDEAIATVASSLQEFGWRQPIVVDTKNVVIVGHTRLLAAKTLGMEKVPVHVADKLTEEQVRAYRIADNAAGERTTWDKDLLPLELDLLKAADYDLTLTALTDDMLSVMQDDIEVEEQDEVEPPEDPVTKLGDLIKLDEHRLLCGDSTKSDVVHGFVGDLSVDLLVTDPPYGVAYQTALSTHEAAARNRRKDGLEVANDDLGWDGTKQLVQDSISNVPLKKGGVFYVFCPPGDLQAAFYLGLKEADLVARHQLVWIKDRFVMGRCDYHYKHEVILYGWRDGASHYFVDDRKQDSVWEYKRPGTSKEHPTMKPLGLVAKAIKNSSKKGDIVYDPFLGSGSTLLASDQLGRVCHGCELDPRYCDVIVSRWEKQSGKKAERVSG